MAEKQLIVVVEGTSAMGPYWNTVLSEYLEKIIRCFCGKDFPGQMLSAASMELSLVVFNIHGPRSDCMVQRSGWTRDVDVFLQWLSAISFTGGGFSEAAVGEGLSEALMMFSLVPDGSQNLNVHKHCILVGASDPFLLPTPVYRPQVSNVEQGGNMEVLTKSYLADAETVAKSFAQCSISLSLISPRHLLKLRAIYNAGKHNSRAEDPSVNSVKNLQFLVLLSENFTEARAALSHPGIPQSLQPTGPATTNVSDLNYLSQARQMMSSASLIGASDMRPPQSLQPTGPATTNVSILNYLSQARQMISSASLIGASDMRLQTIGGTPMAMHMSNMISSRSSGAMQTGAPVKYKRVWQGALRQMRGGKPVLITKLEGYRSASATETLVADWPPMMQYDRLIPLNYMLDKQYEAGFLIFRALKEHTFLEQQQKKNLCAVIWLPSQTLLLSVFDKGILVGLVFPGERVMFKAPIPTEQQQRQLQQQQQQQQHSQQQQLHQQQQHHFQLQHPLSPQQWPLSFDPQFFNPDYYPELDIANLPDSWKS